MRTRHLNLLLLSVVIVLAALLWRDLRPTPPKATPLTPLQAGRVSTMSITRDGLSDIKLSRKGDQWQMVAPWSARADQERVSRLLGVLSQPGGKDYALTEVDPKELGLAPPQAVLRVDDLELRFGGASPLNHRRYVQVGGRVHLLEDRYFYQLRSRASDFADPHPLPTGATIDALRLPGLTLTRGDHGWQVEPPLNSETQSADAPQSLIDAWRFASAREVVPANAITPDDERVEVQLRGRAEPLLLWLRRDDDGLQLIDPTTGLAWRFGQSAAEHLLELPTITPDA